jgi:hypothetical protein
MKKHQHFIPRLHLKRFASAHGQLGLYLPKEDLLIQTTQSVASTAVERHGYSVRVAGKRTDALEDALADGIEDRVPSVLDQIDAAPSGPLRLAQDDRVRLSRYLGSLYTRVPAMAATFVKVMNELVSEPGWQGLSNPYIDRLVVLCQLTTKADERAAWEVVLGYLKPGAPRPMLQDDSRLHRLAIGSLLVGSMVLSADWTVFRMGGTARNVLPDRPMAIMGRLGADSFAQADAFFAVRLSPSSLLVGMSNSPLANTVASGDFSYPFLREKWSHSFPLDAPVENPAVFHARLALSFADREIYPSSSDDLNRVRRLAGRVLPARIAQVRP